MLNHADIIDVANEVGQEKPIFRRDQLSFAEGPVDLYGGTLVVSGDAGPGGVVRGQGNVVINGSLVGNQQKPIHIEVDGDVVIRGSASHALLDGCWVYVEDEAINVQVNARLGFDVGGDLGAARVRLGDYDIERKRIDHLKKQLKDALWERETIERKLKMEEKRVDKIFKNTRVVLASNVGRILQAKRNRLEVNLAPIYESLLGRQEKEIDNALREFFAKAVVGLLTRTNQHFLMSKNRHRQEIFKGIIRDVHDLFFLTRKFDKNSQQCEVLSKLVDEAVRELHGRFAGVFVRGKCKPDLEISIILPDVTVSNAGEVMVSGDIARMQIIRTSEGGCVAECVSTLGIKASHVLDADTLQDCEISILDEDVVWSSIQAHKVADV
jgi:hypothetical protein